jgi:tetratricopeptide (TPR) repeat protein
MADGHAAFLEGQYGVAARYFLLSATLNQTDPTSRLCAAHTQIALGHFDVAAKLLRRAFEIQPLLVYLLMDVRGAYGELGDFDDHLAFLRATVEKEPVGADQLFVLGYFLYFSNNEVEAAGVLARALKLAPNDPVLQSFAEVARLTTPATMIPHGGNSGAGQTTQGTSQGKKTVGVL